MNPVLLTENGWKAIALKFKAKDNGLQRALSVYEKLADDEYAELLKAIASVSLLAGNLKKVKEVAALPTVAKYLADLVSAAESERKQIEAAASKVAELKTKSLEMQQDVTLNKAKTADIAFKKMDDYIKG